MPETTADTNALELATELTVAWLANPNTRAGADEIPTFLARMHDAVSNIARGGSSEEAAVQAGEQVEPAVSVRKSLASKDHILSLIDGKPYRTLKRHLARHGFTPEQYRERFGLKRDYPMVSEAYSEVRRAMAHKIGLGHKKSTGGASTNGEAASVAEAKPKRVGGRRKAAPPAE